MIINQLTQGVENLFRPTTIEEFRKVILNVLLKDTKIDSLRAMLMSISKLYFTYKIVIRNSPKILGKGGQ